jgi:hypothetical protein
MALLRSVCDTTSKRCCDEMPNVIKRSSLIKWSGVVAGDRKRVAQGGAGFFKINTVFAFVGSGFVVIPFKFHYFSFF